MSTDPHKRPTRARSGLRPAPAKSKPNVPGEGQSKAPAPGSDARHPQDKDANDEAKRQLDGESEPKKP
jgi:hypothetical protein